MDRAKLVLEKGSAPEERTTYLPEGKRRGANYEPGREMVHYPLRGRGRKGPPKARVL